MAEQHNERRTLKRRGLIAGAAALVAGIAATRTAQPVAAAATMQFANTATTVTNTASGETGLVAASGSNPGVLLLVDGSAASTVSGNTIAIQTLTSGTGGIGLLATSPNGDGVSGSTAAPAGSGYAGVIGSSSNKGTFGVFGNSPAGIGIYGTSANGTGVYGQTNAAFNYGVLGTTYVANSTAVAGTCVANGSSAFSGGTGNPNAFAGVFQGNVVIQGKLVVSDPSYKSGALQHPDGSTRLVYCVESPESWIEDVGKGQLVGGKATVTFDKDFVAVTHTDDYRVFVTAHGDSKGLYVTNESAGGFEVREQQGGTSTLPFSWKVMVKAKSSVKSERLGKFTMPSIPLPDVSKLPKPEELPAATAPKKP